MLQPPELAAAPTRTQDDLAEPESDGGFGGAEFFSAEIRPFRPKFEFVTVETGDPFFKTSKLARLGKACLACMVTVSKHEVRYRISIGMEWHGSLLGIP